MDLDEYDDELPPISVNFSNKDESVFAMPSAEVLASQRARAEQCERELQQLRAQHELQESQLKAATGNTAPIAPSRSDSSGSEGETALATAVEALRVDNSAPLLPAPPSRGSVFARVLQLRAGLQLCQAYSDAILTRQRLDSLDDDILTGIESWVSGLGADCEDMNEGKPPELPTDDEVCDVGAWLCVYVLCADRSVRARAALHALVGVATIQQVRSLASLLVPAAASPGGLLQLSRLLQAAPRDTHCALLAGSLTRAALLNLLGDNTSLQENNGKRNEVSMEPLTMQEIADLITRGWKHVGVQDRDAALQLLGRALAAAKRASERSERDEQALARSLAALAQPPNNSQVDRHAPDHLKIAVTASKLKILLSDRN